MGCGPERNAGGIPRQPLGLVPGKLFPAWGGLPTVLLLCCTCLEEPDLPPESLACCPLSACPMPAPLCSLA